MFPANKLLMWSKTRLWGHDHKGCIQNWENAVSEGSLTRHQGIKDHPKLVVPFYRLDFWKIYPLILYIFHISVGNTNSVWFSDTLTLFPAASLPLPSSATWKRRFSRRMTEPEGGLAQALSTSAPTQSFRNVTSLEQQQKIFMIN